MAIYEYKIVQVRPGISRRRGALERLDLEELSTEINIRAISGWEFVGTEQVTQRTRRWFVLSDVRDVTCLVFRREANPRVGVAKHHARAIADVAQEIPIRRATRPDLVQAVRDGHRRVRVGGRNGVDVAAE